MSSFTDLAVVSCVQAYVKIAEFDVILEILLINRTDSTLTNVTVELATMGDLRLVERPPTFTLAPKDSRTIKANIKVCGVHNDGAAAMQTVCTREDL